MARDFELDKIDWQIINELSINSRQSYRRLARKLGLAISTIASRIEKLVNNEVIKRFCLELNPEKIGLDLTAIINIRAKSGKSNEIEKMVSKMKGVLAIYDTTGISDSIAIVKAKSRKELNEIIMKILGIEHVERTDTQIVLNSIKESFAWIPNL